MRNKKSPAMMIVAAVVILGFAFFLNATSFMTRPLLPEAPKEQAEQRKISESDSKNMLKASLSRGGDTERTGAMPSSSSSVPDEPAILKPKTKRYDPQLNPTSTAAHWWDDDGVLQKQSEETRKKRGF
ncbi:MAG: hypothetical protein KF824_07715 [Fimbriimonadaceae bacterium]|nr:MAG: hypothetical protein KF824_07715 [Fimbriimonadaceae bacterium]